MPNDATAGFYSLRDTAFLGGALPCSHGSEQEVLLLPSPSAPGGSLPLGVECGSLLPGTPSLPRGLGPLPGPAVSSRPPWAATPEGLSLAFPRAACSCRRSCLLTSGDAGVPSGLDGLRFTQLFYCWAVSLPSSPPPLRVTLQCTQISLAE